MEGIQNITAAFVAAYKDIEGAVKGPTNEHFNHQYADLASVIAAIKPHLVAHDLCTVQKLHPHPDGIDLETILTHTSGESMSLGRLFVPAVKHDAQGFGSSLTYARRYGLSTAFSLPVYDDDGEMARKAKEKQDTQPLDDPRFASLVEAADNGTAALQAAYTDLRDEKVKGLAPWWRKHGVQLKNTAAKTTDEEAEA